MRHLLCTNPATISRLTCRFLPGKGVSLIFMPLFLLYASVFSLSAQVQIESIDRGIAAVYTGSSGVFVSWRLLADDPDSIAFNIYRGSTKLNIAPLNSSTNYTDAGGTASDNYHVVSVIRGAEETSSKTVQPWTTSYLSIPLQTPSGGTVPDATTYTYNANDCSTADLDGDGEYEIVLKWDPSNSKDNSQSGYTGNVLLDAYKLDGTLLWRIDLGINIRAGAHYTQFMVYDLDGDGKAELACKTAPGTKDASGNFIKLGPAATADHNADYRNTSGYILSGPEYFTIFNGVTGLELATDNYDPPRGDLASWGDTYGNRVDRFLACIAYLDGTRPSVVMCRGYYTGSGRGRTVLAAWDYRNSSLTRRWTFSADYIGANSGYTGQGNHNLSVGDVDDDGKDEIIYGSCAINDNGTGLWTTGFGHGDAMHLSDIDPSRPGLEVWGIHEGTTTPGSALLDARTGALIWKTADADVGRGVAADLLATSPGMECWGGTDGLRSPKDVRVGNAPGSTNHVIYWDGDLTQELLNDIYIDKYGGSNLLNAAGCASNNGTKANPALQADILGDWREEVLFRTSDNTALRLYTTTIPSDFRVTCLMHDHIYRMGIAWQNVAYNQPPHLGYYLCTDSILKQKGAPSGFYARNDFQKIKLFWDPVTIGTVAGYNVYYSATSGKSYTKLNSSPITETSYQRVPVPNNTAAYYVVTSVSSNGVESPYSVEISSAAGPITHLQENEGIVSGGTIDSNNAGYNGTGFFNFGTSNSYAEFVNIGGHLGGKYILKFRYALGTANRTGSLIINGVSQNLTMKSTSSWTNYVYDSVEVTLNRGFTNTIRFASTGSDFGNLDEIIVRPSYIVGIEDLTSPDRILITKLFPNPFTERITIGLSVEKSCRTVIDIITVQGKTVKTLGSKKYDPGYFELTWNATDDSGKPVPAGIYYLRLSIEGRSPVLKKVVCYGR